VTIGSAGFFTNTFMITYVTTYQGIPRATILDCLFLVTILQFLTQPLAALLAERIGEAASSSWQPCCAWPCPTPCSCW
jgi:hypothetical protein